MVPPGGRDLYGASQKICVVLVVGTKTNCPSESVCANKPGRLSTEIVAPGMGFWVAASITVPDAAGERDEKRKSHHVPPVAHVRPNGEGRPTTCHGAPGLQFQLGPGVPWPP